MVSLLSLLRLLQRYSHKQSAYYRGTVTNRATPAALVTSEQEQDPRGRRDPWMLVGEMYA